jgi:hypothetical protein
VRTLPYYSHALNLWAAGAASVTLWAAFDAAVVTLLANPALRGATWLLYLFAPIAAAAGAYAAAAQWSRVELASGAPSAQMQLVFC